MQATMDGLYDELVIDDNFVTIQPKKKSILGYIAKKKKGTKAIPIFSIGGIQLHKSTLMGRGYIEFSVAGAIENKKIDPLENENVFMYGSDNARAEEIVAIIQQKIVAARAPQTSSNQSTDMVAELKKLADLKEQGILDEEEFKQAKNKLLSS